MIFHENEGNKQGWWCKKSTRVVLENDNYSYIYFNETFLCDRIWENPPCSEFYEILVSCTFDKLYPRANLPPSLKLRASLWS